MALAAAQRLGECVAQARKRRGLTQAALAQQAGLSLPTVQRLEQGQAQLSTGRLFDVLDVLDPELLQKVVDVVAADTLGQAIQDQRQPQRVRSRRRGF